MTEFGSEKERERERREGRREVNRTEKLIKNTVRIAEFHESTIH